MEVVYTQAVAVLLGIIYGLWVRRLLRSLLLLITLAGIVALVLVFTGRGDVLEAHRDLMPQALTIGARVFIAIKQVLIGTPAALAGLLLGIAIREVVALAKS